MKGFHQIRSFQFREQNKHQTFPFPTNVHPFILSPTNSKAHTMITDHLTIYTYAPFLPLHPSSVNPFILMNNDSPSTSVNEARRTSTPIKLRSSFKRTGCLKCFSLQCGREQFTDRCSIASEC